MPVLNFVCVEHIKVYYGNYLQAFRIFYCSSFLVKMVNHYENHVIFQDIEHQPQEDILHHFLHYSFFFMTSSLN